MNYFGKKMVYKYYADSGLLTLEKPFSEIFKISYHLSIIQKTYTIQSTLLEVYNEDALTINGTWPREYVNALYYMNGLEKLVINVEDLTNLPTLTKIPPNLKDIKYHKI